MKTKGLFYGRYNRLSSKRVFGAILLFIAVSLWIDSHFTVRVLDEKAFDTVMYTAGLMIVGGVLEGKFTQQQASTPPSEEPEEDYK